MRKFFRFLFDFSFVLLAIAFVGAILSTLVSPKVFWPLAFLGLGYPILFLLVALFFLFWLVNRNKKMLYPAILLLIGLVSIPGAFNLKLKKAGKTSDNQIKVMSYNVRNFEVYDKKGGGEKRDKIIALIKKEKPDVLCIQEAHQREKYINFKEFAKEVNLPYFHFEVGVNAKRGGEFGVATFSKYPISNIKSYAFGSGGNVGSQVEIEVDDRIVSVFNIHLESANIESSYYNYGSKEMKEISEKKLTKRSKRVAKQLQAAFSNRANQAETIRKEIKKSKNPVILCGDFNDTPSSYAYAKVKGGLQDTFKKGKLGFGETYPQIPILRIDHILVSRKFKVLDYQIRKEKISDHYPVITQLELKK